MSGDRPVDLRTPLARLSGVTCSYGGAPVLRGVDLEVAASQFTGVVGPSGSGKTTLLKLLLGSVRPGAGTVERRDGLRVGYVPQVRNVFGTLSVEENLRMGVFLRPERFASRRDEVYSLFPVLGDRRNQRAESLSGGQRQVLAMGRALMMEPSLLLLDEPSAGLSPAMQDEVFERITAINGEGVSILIVEQNAHKALRICDRGYVLDQGVVAHTGRGIELLDDPTVVELYLGSLARPR